MYNKSNRRDFISYFREMCLMYVAYAQIISEVFCHCFDWEVKGRLGVSLSRHLCIEWVPLMYSVLTYEMIVMG